MRLFKKKAALAAVSLLFSAALFSQIGVLSVQGILENTNGQAVDDGSYDFTFKLYTVAVDGTEIWTETQTGLPVTSGIYSAKLGSVASLDALPFDVPYFLGVTVNGEIMPTRAPLSAAPYAMAYNGTTNKFPSGGKVGINTATPKTTLDVDGSISTGAVTTTAATYTVSPADHVVFLELAGAQSVTLPSAAAFPNREIVLINKTTTNKTASSYRDMRDSITTQIPKGDMIELRSNGTEWRQTDQYALPEISAPTTPKAYVYAYHAAFSVAGGSTTSFGPTWTEVIDNTNAFISTTFTAPRTGLYRVSGLLVMNHSAITAGAHNIRGVFTGTCGFMCTSPVKECGGSYCALGTTQSGVNFGGIVKMVAGQTFSTSWVYFSGIQSISGSSSVNHGLLTILEL